MLNKEDRGSNMNKPPKIVAATSCYKRPMFTEFCVPLAMSNAGIHASWLLIDDGSLDATEGILRTLGRRKDTTVSIHKDNKGMYHRHNMAIDYALEMKADYLAWFDNDLLLPPNWLRDLVATARGCNLDVASAWPVNDKTATKMIVEKSYGLARKIPEDAVVMTGVCGSTCTITNAKALLSGVRYNENRQPWTFGDSKYHSCLEKRGYAIGYYTGVKIWMLERLIWLDPEYEKRKLAIRHRHRNRGKEVDYDGELQRYKDTLLGGGSVDTIRNSE